MAYPATAQQVTGPALGFLVDRHAAQVRPVFGSAAAATVGDPIALPADAADVTVAPGYVLFLSGPAREAALWSRSTGQIQIAGVTPGADSIVISRAGTTAAFLHISGGFVEVVTGLPKAPAPPDIFALTSLRNGLQQLTVSDDGAFLLCAERPAPGVQASAAAVISQAGELNRLTFASPLTALAFGSHQALLASASSTLLLPDAGDFTPPLDLSATIPGAIAAAFSADNRHIYALNAAGRIGIVDLASPGYPATTIDCQCRLDGVTPLERDETYRLNEYRGGPFRILDGEASPARIVIVPPPPTTDRQP